MGPVQGHQCPYDAPSVAEHFRKTGTVNLNPADVLLFRDSLVTLFVVSSFHSAIVLTIILGVPVAYAVHFAIMRYKKSRLLAQPIASQIKSYEEALAAYQSKQEETERARREAERAQEEAERIRREAEGVRRVAERPRLEAERARRRKLREYWMSLSGVEFEQELGEVFKQLGYVVQSTPSTGDQGIDLILKKDGKTTIVQCKGYQSPVGPSVARELFGSLVASKADDAILACTGGFTQGVKQFVRGKRINLLSAAELAKMGESIQYASKDGPDNPPTCPTPRCGEKMVLRTGKYGKFWGCPEWPVCNGTKHFREP